MRKIKLGNGIEQWFSVWTSQTSTINITGELIRNANPQAPPLTY